MVFVKLIGCYALKFLAAKALVFQYSIKRLNMGIWIQQDTTGTVPFVCNRNRPFCFVPFVSKCHPKSG